MDNQAFKALLVSATEAAKGFALKYVNNNLPAENIYHVHLNLSHDDSALTQFDLYPGDEGKVIKAAKVSKVVQLLLRKGKVPVWIDISVTGIKHGKTVLTLLCAGRFSDNIREMYYHQRGLGPFGVKSPALPYDCKEGMKFSLPEEKKWYWVRLFRRYRHS